MNKILIIDKDLILCKENNWKEKYQMFNYAIHFLFRKLKNKTKQKKTIKLITLHFKMIIIAL
jgi:hypothetical protein